MLRQDTGLFSLGMLVPCTIMQAVGQLHGIDTFTAQHTVPSLTNEIHWVVQPETV